MLEIEKRKYPLWRVNCEDRTASMIGKINAAIYFVSDRRDEDQDALCVYLKKTYRGICDRCEARQGDIVRLSEGEDARIISIDFVGGEGELHLESTQIIDTGAVDFKEDGDV